MLALRQFTYGLQELLRPEGLMQRALGTKERGNFQQIYPDTLATARDGDDLHLGVALPQLRDGFEPILLRHQDIRNDQINSIGVVLRHALAAIVRDHDLVARVFSYGLQEGTELHIIIDNQDTGHGARSAACVSKTDRDHGAVPAITSAGTR